MSLRSKPELCPRKQATIFKNGTQLPKSVASKGGGPQKEGNKESTALLATAFQDHFTKSLSLSTDYSRRKQINHSLPVKKNSNVISKVSTNRGRKVSESKQNAEQEKEYVLDPKPPPLTLAQKLGLVDSPIKALSEAEWQHVKNASNRRGDSTEPCPICKECFGLNEQVLLSCTHVFHKVCLQSFERFARKKVCPLCRKEQYQTRLIHEGAKKCREQSAARIQAAWRGYIVRSWYKELRKEIPPRDPLLRKKFYQMKLSDINSRVLNSFDTFHRSIDSFLEEVDENLRYSQSVMRQLDGSSDSASYVADWDAIQLKAVERSEINCPICIMPLKVHPSNESGKQDQKACLLLSCSHVYHPRCLESFEEFAVGERHLCPICRSSYQKKKIRW